MNKKYSYFELEDYLLDDDFLRIAKSHFKGEDPETWGQLLQNYPERKLILENAYQIINSIRIKEISVEEEQVSEEWNMLKARIRQRKKRRIFLRVSTVAACFILILAGFYFGTLSETASADKNTLLSILTEIEAGSDDIQLILGKDKKTSVEENATIREKDDGSFTINQDTTIEAGKAIADYIQLIVPKGKRSYLELKDGSRIWVNSGSKLLYPSHFSDRKREIYVDGEIYLEVVPDASSPFYVRTAVLDVKVLGTSFNISAYSDDVFAEVVLVEGSVEVNALDHTTRLVPNTCYHLEDSQEQTTQVDVYNYVCWKDGIMKMEGEELKDIFKKLSRYYNVHIIVPPELEKVHYFGKLGLEDNIELVLYNISLITPIGFERDDGHIRIYSIHK